MNIPFENQELNELNELSAEFVESSEQVEPLEMPDTEVKNIGSLGHSPSFGCSTNCVCGTRMSCTVGV